MSGRRPTCWRSRPRTAHGLRIPHPILTNRQLAAVKEMELGGWRTKLIDITYPRTRRPERFDRALDRICAEAEQAIDAGCTIVLSVRSPH